MRRRSTRLLASGIDVDARVRARADRPDVGGGAGPGRCRAAAARARRPRDLRDDRGLTAAEIARQAGHATSSKRSPARDGRVACDRRARAAHRRCDRGRGWQLRCGRAQRMAGRPSRSASSCRSLPAAARRSSPARPRPSCGKLLGQSVYRRQQARRRRQRRDGRGRRAPTDQHTLILGHIGTLAVNPFIFDKLPVRPDQGLQADLAARQGAEPVRRPPRRAGEEPEGVRRPREGEAGPAQLRLGRQRQRRPPRLRVPEDGHRHRSSSTCRTAAPARSSPTCSPAACRRRRSARRRSCSSSRPASCAASRPARSQRIAQLPDVPTVAEQGCPGFEMTQWYGLLAPASLAARRTPTSSPPPRRARSREPAALERLQQRRGDRRRQHAGRVRRASSPRSASAGSR